MASTYTKGRAREKKAKQILEKEGWLVEAKNWSKWLSKDFYQLFDLLAVKGSDIKLIQVKSRLPDFYTARKAIRGWKAKTGVTVQCEVWVWIPDTKGFRIDIV